MRDFEREYDYIAATTQGEWRLPPGLKRALPYYARRKWVNFGEPIPLFEHLHQVFGKIAHYRFMGTTIVFVNEPEWINEILVNQASSFVRERTLKRMKILLGEGLITSDDPIHMRQRRIAAPAFHRQRIAGYADQIVANAAASAANWQAGQEIDISDEMMQLSLHIVAKTLFDSEVTPDVLSVRDEVNTIMGLYNFLVAFPRLESVLHWPIPGVMKFRRSRARLDALVASMIASRRALTRQQLEERTDLLSLLMAARDDDATKTGMSDTQVRDEVLTIFLAGYETVANALAWTWYLLSQNPDAADKMYAEVEAVLGTTTATMHSFHRLKYTEMVFAESMRLYPPAWAMGRQSTKPVEFGSYRFPPQTHFFISQYIMQRSPEFWPDPLAFRPERHTPEAKSERPRFVYFPFGGGGRQCIGEGFAWMEGVLALATIAQKWRLHFVPKYPIVAQARITLRPKFPMIMRVQPSR
ncbi:MAG: cytochrome P450 [Acidobacteria bacterium]|nr:cytochrome P450 [Acidobacteriota bacterium]